MKAKPILFPFLFITCFIPFTDAQHHSSQFKNAAQVSENIFMQKTEVSIREWMIFIIDHDFDSLLFPNYFILPPPANMLFLDLKQKGNFTYLNINEHPDKTFRKQGINHVAPSHDLTKLCKEHFPDFSIDLPVTAITYAQAVRYGEWLEKCINQNEPFNIQVSLPTDSIFTLVIPNWDSLNTKGCALFNFVKCTCRSQTKEDYNAFLGKNLVRVDALIPTSAGLYNLLGNAAEMTNVEGIAMGGSFRHFAKDAYSDTIINYTGAEDWLGFRVIFTTY